MKKRTRKERKEAFKQAYYNELKKQGIKDEPKKKEKKSTKVTKKKEKKSTKVTKKKEEE